ncbi:MULTISPECIES: type I polyketide synthase [Cobetia]|uniref:type I polyketide synthase n=1 Tax=Cobetia TaxID=204286 RepID=UPI0015839339|nr:MULTISPECIES: type I polyketide synthase [Cobetia]MDI4661925.1 SDR family NAD(P)-dependent oxidoreductase [Cobetia sp. BMC6]NUJ57807.1 SDR family NAD(P)-dependent oxidoreductase [Cobetia marina]
MTRRVAIIGAASRFPGTTQATLWDDLLAGKDMVTEVADDRWSKESLSHPDKKAPGMSYSFAAGSLGDITGFDPAFFGISPREAASMDPQQRMLLEMSWEAIEHAGIPAEKMRGSRCGVFMGIASLDYSYRMADDLSAIGPNTATGNTSSVASNRLSYAFDLHGPSLSLDTACSSSLVAFHQACQSIRSGETDMALTGGISLHLHPYGFLIFSKATMLSKTGRCQVFDEAGDGYARSEGGGVFLLKDLDQAIADGDRILAVVASSVVNTDGYKSGLTVPNPAAQIQLMEQACEQAGIQPDEIDYLEAHGTGTAVGDPLETRAIGAAIGQKRSSPLPIGSIKSNMGHLETASGVAGLAKALGVIAHREVPATIKIQRLNPKIRSDEWNLDIVTQPRKLKADGRLVVGVNSFGFGGANAHVLLESAPEQSIAQPHTAGEQTPPLRLSARSPQALKQSALELAEHLRELAAHDMAPSLYDLAWQLAARREHHVHGALLSADNFTTLLQDLDTLGSEGDLGDHPRITLADRLPALPSASDNDASPRATTNAPTPVKERGPVFVYSGNGCQWAGMGRALMEESPSVRACLERLDAAFRDFNGFELLKELDGSLSEKGENRLDATEIAQPTLFALQVAVTEWLIERGIRPAAVTGHSVGEVAAAWASGALTLEQATRVIFQRSYHQGRTRGTGAMMAVGLGECEMREWLEQPQWASLSLAGINGPRGTTLAGERELLEALSKELSAQGTFARVLGLDYAFHSPAMDPIKPGLLESLDGLAPRATHTPFISTVTGSVIAGEQLDARYWWENIRQPVMFEAAVTSLVNWHSEAEENAALGRHRLLVEIGAHPILRSYLNDILKARSDEAPTGQVHASLDRRHAGLDALEHLRCRVLLSGAVDITGLFPVAGQFVELPSYPWQRIPCWLQTTSESQRLLDRHYVHPLLGYRLAQQRLTWEAQLDTQKVAWLADHQVGESAVFPGAGYLEQCLAAAHEWQAASADADSLPDVLDLEDFEIRAPLLLDDSTLRLTRLSLDSANGYMRLESRETRAEDADKWNLHAVARAFTATRGRLLERAAPVMPTRAADFGRDEHVAAAAQLGLHYGPHFRAAEQIWVDAGADHHTPGTARPQVLARFSLTEEMASQDADFYLHPGVLDSAFQLFIPLLGVLKGQMAASNGMAFVPVRVGRLQVREQVRASQIVTARVVLRSRGPHSLCADFELFDAEGRAVAVAEEARFRAVRLGRDGTAHLDYLDIALTAAPHPLTQPTAPILNLAGLVNDAMQASEAADDGEDDEANVGESTGENNVAESDAAASAQTLLADSQCFRDELEPLLDSLMLASVHETLLRHAAPGDPEVAHLDHEALSRWQRRCPLFSRTLLDWAESQGLTEALDSGDWQINSLDLPAANDIWQLLVRDYPGQFPLTHATGRLHLHLDEWLNRGMPLGGQLEGAQSEETQLDGTADETVADREALLSADASAALEHLRQPLIPTLLKTAVGNAGWQWLSAQLDQRISSALATLPAGQRLDVLELGAGGPWLGQRLATLREADARNGRYAALDYRFVAASTGALSEANRLQDDLPLIDVIAGETFQDTAPTRKAQLAIVHLDFEAPSQARELLTALIAHLAPGAQLLLCGCEPAAWAGPILALDDGEQLRSHPGIAQWQRLLTQLGLVIETPDASVAGAWWLSATLAAQAPLAALAKTAEDQMAAGESVESESLESEAVASQAATLSIALLDSPQAPANQTLLTSLSDSLAARGHQVSHQRLPASLPVDASGLIEQLGDVDHLIALPSAAATAEKNDTDSTNALQCARQQLLTQVAQAFDSAQEQDDSRLAPTLWVLTHDVATLWQTSDAPAATPPADAASWGFARSLANESQSLTIRLLDTPTLEHDAISMSALMDALVQELEAPDHEQEVVLDATGARFATRLRQVAAPQQAAGAENARLQASGTQRHAVSLGFSQPGQLRNLEWQPRILPAVAAGEVEVRVEATGLNFRDVMYTLGLLSDEAIEHGFSGPSLGLEFSGIVTQAGANAEFTIGDRVVGFGPASFSDRLVIADTALAHVPHGVSLEAAATIPTTFFTVYYALKHLARLEEGEKVLIHGAAGGVGIAALQIAEWLGAEVFATVGSPAKRDFLALMGIDNVYDSRSHGFAEDILADLAAHQQRDSSVDARGVDVVLNSLAGEAIAQNLRVLKPFGRFCELGKRDFYENTPMGLRPFRNNLSYFGIDSDQLMKECPGLTTRLFREMMALFEDGTLAPLPYTTFDASQVVEAFRYMQQARQIGKVVVTQHTAEHAAEKTASAVPHQPDTLAADQKTLTIDPAGSYLVTGGLGGFGLRSAEWLAALGARELVLLGRSGAASEEAQQGVARLEAQGVNVHALACDVADEAALSKVFARFGKSAEDDGIAPLKGIIHAAAVIDDALIRHLDAERIQRVMTPKLEGARLLDRLSAEHALDFFVLYSSATTLFGNPGQSVYVAANHWLEGLAANRRARGLPATCARWGAIEDAGFLARNEKTREALKNRLGGDALMADHALACLGEMISADQNAQALGLPGRSLGVLELDWAALARFLPTAATPRFEEIARRAGEDDNSQAQQDDIAAALAGLSGEALQTAIVEILKGELSKILLIDASAIDVNKSVYDMGFDSLMGVELMTAVEARLGISIPVMMISEAATLWRLAERLMHKMGNADGEEAESNSEDQAMAQLVKQHGGETATLTERGEMVSK